MTQEKILYLSRSDVEAAGPSMADIIVALEAMFMEKAAGRTEMPPKPGIHTRPDTFIHAMPAYIASTGAAGMKWVSSYPSNRSLGLPNISGLIVLNDPETGLPVAIMDCSWITAKRTGAATAVAAKYLARREARTAGILGCGVQGRSNLEALRAVFSLGRITAYDNDPGVLSRFVAEAASGTGMEVVAARVPEEAVRGADIVITAGPIVKVPHATIRPGWLEAGAFASLVDYDSYTGTAGPWPRSTSSARTTSPRWISPNRWGFLRKSRPSMPSSPISSAAGDRAAKTPGNGPWPATWAWPWTTWPQRPSSCGGPGKWGSEPGSNRKRIAVTRPGEAPAGSPRPRASIRHRGRSVDGVFQAGCPGSGARPHRSLRRRPPGT